MATVENAIQIILNEFSDRQGNMIADNTSDNGGNDQISRVQYDLMSQNRIAPSQMSDNVSFKSANFQGHLEGFKKKVEIIKMRQSHIYN